MALKDHYPARYASWAGNPTGIKPNLNRCCAQVHRDYRMYQCSRPNGHGPDGAYCTQHDPQAVAARQLEQDRAYQVRLYNQLIRDLRGADKVIKAIADGHNDPRALAQAWLDKMGARLDCPVPPPPPPPK